MSGLPPLAKLVGSPSSSEIKLGFTVTFGSLFKTAKVVKNSKRKGLSITLSISSFDDLLFARSTSLV